MIVQGQAFPTDKHAHIQSLLGFYAAPPVSTIDQTQEQSCTFVLGCLFPFVFVRGQRKTAGCRPCSGLFLFFACWEVLGYLQFLCILRIILK